MIRFVLDTDTLTLFERRHALVVAAVTANASETVLTTPTIEEQFGGWFAQLRKVKTPADQARISQNIAATAELLSAFHILPMTEPSIARFDGLVKLKLNIGRMDLRIAAIALEVQATVVSRNLRDFGRVPGLTVVDWSA